MKLKNLFFINIFCAIFFGGSCTFLPVFTFSLYGIVPDESAIWVSRLCGGSILGFATLMWFGMKSPSSETRWAIAFALLIQDTVGFIASVVFQLTGKVNYFGWMSVALYAFLALAYAYFLFIRPDKS
jgi:hypothetical protein